LSPTHASLPASRPNATRLCVCGVQPATTAISAPPESAAAKFVTAKPATFAVSSTAFDAPTVATPTGSTSTAAATGADPVAAETSARPRAASAHAAAPLNELLRPAARGVDAGRCAGPRATRSDSNVDRRRRSEARASSEGGSGGGGGGGGGGGEGGSCGGSNLSTCCGRCSDEPALAARRWAAAAARLASALRSATRLASRTGSSAACLSSWFRFTAARKPSDRWVACQAEYTALEAGELSALSRCETPRLAERSRQRRMAKSSSLRLTSPPRLPAIEAESTTHDVSTGSSRPRAARRAALRRSRSRCSPDACIDRASFGILCLHQSPWLFVAIWGAK